MAVKDRIIYADVLRIIATIAVVIFHVSTDRWFSGYNNLLEWNVINFFVSELRWCVPMFFMLSGMNFLNPDREITLGKLYKKSIARLLCALVFWSLVYKFIALFFKYRAGESVGLNSIIDISYGWIFEQSWFHLWFLYPLIGLYIISPVIRVFTANASKTIFVYLLILFAVFSYIIPCISDYYGRWMALFVPGLSEPLGYFLAGYFFYKYHLSKKQRSLLYILGVLSAIAMLAISTGYMYSTGYSASPRIFGYYSILVAIITVSLFVYVRQLFNNKSINDKFANEKVVSFSNKSFGIYLTHPLFFSALQIMNINTGSFNPLLSVLFISIFLLLSSYILTTIIGKIPILNKWII